jgi:Tol biopolymer transport system component
MNWKKLFAHLGYVGLALVIIAWFRPIVASGLNRAHIPLPAWAPAWIFFIVLALICIDLARHSETKVYWHVLLLGILSYILNLGASLVALNVFKGELLGKESYRILPYLGAALLAPILAAGWKKKDPLDAPAPFKTRQRKVTVASTKPAGASTPSPSPEPSASIPSPISRRTLMIRVSFILGLLGFLLIWHIWGLSMQKAAFYRSLDRNVYTYSPASKTRTPITTDGGSYSAKLSHSGEVLVFCNVGKDRDGYALCLVDLKSGERKRLIESGTFLDEPNWGRDDERIYFLQEDPQGGRDIYKMDLAASQPDKITDDRMFRSNLRISPDGNYLAFLARRSKRGLRQLFLLEITTGKTAQLTHASGLNAPKEISWVAGGDEMAYVTLYNDYIVRIGTDGKPRQAIRIGEEYRALTNLVCDPKDRDVYFVKAEKRTLNYGSEYFFFSVNGTSNAWRALEKTDEITRMDISYDGNTRIYEK